MSLTLFLILALLTPSLSHGLGIPDLSDLRKETREAILSHLEELRERTPKGKAMVRWKESRKRAEAALERARAESAERYAPQDFEEALRLLDVGLEYARRGEFWKAEYLARKAAEAGERAAERAADARRARADAIQARLKEAFRRITELEAKDPEGGRLLEERLSWARAGDLLEAEDYNGSEEELSRLEAMLKAEEEGASRREKVE